MPLTSLYFRYVMWKVMILIVGRSCVSSRNYDDSVFTEISHVIYVTDSKMGDDLFTFLLLGIINISLCLQCHVVVLDALYMIVTILQIIVNKGKCCIFFFYGVLMFSLYFFYTLSGEPFYQRYCLPN